MGQRKSKAGRNNVNVGQINCCVFPVNGNDPIVDGPPINSNEFTSIQPKSKENIDELEEFRACC